MMLKLFSRRRKAARRANRKLAPAIAAEVQATELGIARFHSLKERFKGTSPLLRRNIHRLEKGLSMPKRRTDFATKFILETVTLYQNLVAAPEAQPAEVQWSHDVLARYFSVVDLSIREIGQAHTLWASLPARPARGAEPYQVADLARYVGDRPVADGASFEGLTRARRSIRWFHPEPVPDHVIERAVSAALQAPSACNRQPFRFYHAHTPEMVQKISDLPLGTAGFGSSLPHLIAVVGDLSMYAEPRDRHLIFIDAALASMQFMLSMTAQRYGSVPINWPDIPENHQALRDLLGLGAYEVPIMLIGFGRPKEDGMIPYSAKRDVSEVLHAVD